MYKYLEACMVLADISKEALAKRIGMSIPTLNKRLSGESSFTFREALKIRKEIAPNAPLEKLFARGVNKWQDN